MLQLSTTDRHPHQSACSGYLQHEQGLLQNQSLRGATGGVDTVKPDFRVMDNRLIMPPNLLLLSDPSCVDVRDISSWRLQHHSGSVCMHEC